MRPIWRFVSSILTQIQLGTVDLSNSCFPPSACLSLESGSLANANARSCPIDSPISCHNTTSFNDSCCFIYPGGQLLLTQLWDIVPTQSPTNSWTIHGLWADYCDGSYPAYCNAAPNYHNISAIISAHSAQLIKLMQIYWPSIYGSSDHFWDHEWNKHGTCMNTLAPSCYTAEHYRPGMEVVDYFQRAVDLFKSLDTYNTLASAGILPCSTKTYAKEQIQAALSHITGYAVVLSCHGDLLNQVWYNFNVRGSLQNGEFLPTHPNMHGWAGNCPVTGIRYLPKHRVED
ncbi:Ribonuclease T2 [Golovinomyces cichoracearum]|uniref:ribonuclease T2 n=1 Tax=Golovinomyces cichoracearum TaxID=62708 RepID=A0A420I6C0_9PEZI|nr:Ribonuclease T2 [Golovinomyces cichoracearum]